MAPRKLHYKEVYEGKEEKTPGGLTKHDITRLCIKGPAGDPPTYRYVSKARRGLGLARKAADELPMKWEDYTIPKRWHLCAGSRKKKSRGRR